MTQMSKAQQRAVAEAHSVNGSPLGMFSSFVRTSTFRALVRNGWAQGVSPFAGGVTRLGLIAAGVDMDAIHAEALVEHGARGCVVDGTDSPRARRFLRAIHVETDGTVDSVMGVLRDEALADERYAAAGRAMVEQAAAEQGINLETGEDLAPHRPGHLTAARAPQSVSEQLMHLIQRYRTRGTADRRRVIMSEIYKRLMTPLQDGEVRMVTLPGGKCCSVRRVEGGVYVETIAAGELLNAFSGTWPTERDAMRVMYGVIKLGA